MSYGSQVVLYRPYFWQEVKFAWIQYLSILLPMAMFFNWFCQRVYDSKVFRWGFFALLIFKALLVVTKDEKLSMKV